MTRRDTFTTTEADAAHFEEHYGDTYDARDDQPSPSDLRADAEADLYDARQRAARGERRTLGDSVAELEAVVAGWAS